MSVDIVKDLNAGPFVMGSLLTSYPNENFVESVGMLLEDSSIWLPEDLRSNLVSILTSDVWLQDLRSEYISVFDHSKSLNPLYETEYGRERAMFKAKELADIAGFYRAFGFELNPEGGGQEMVDHVSVELEFYSLLLMKLQYLSEMQDQNGVEIVFDATKKFMQDHLGRFVAAILDREGVQKSSFYKMVFSWLAELIEQECQRLQVHPDKVQWLASQVEEEEVSCGATVKFSGASAKANNNLKG